MDQTIFSKQISVGLAILISLVALFAFLYQSELLAIPLVLITIAVFMLLPFRKESPLIRRLLLLEALVLIVWLMLELGFAIVPLIISFMLAYIFDPLATYLQKYKVPRWLVSILIVIIFVGAVAGIAIFVFPAIFLQLDAAIFRVTSIVSSFSEYIESRDFYNFFKKFGIPEETLRSVINDELLPKMRGLYTFILEALLSFLNNISSVVTQVFNVIIIPVLTFYFLKDFGKIKNVISSVLKVKSEKTFNDVKRINNILRKYVIWQIIAATIIAVVCSTAFSIWGIPYPIVLGLLCGLLNPLPYVGIFASLVIAVLTLIIVNPPTLAVDIIYVAAVINTMHFINAYLLEPNIAGKQVGLHPLLVILSLFVFGGMFGFIGLLIAIPTTAALIMFFEDWLKESQLKDKEDTLHKFGDEIL